MAAPIQWFPSLGRGLSRPTERHLESLISVAWKLAIDGRALIEDLEGAAGQPELAVVLRLKLVEFLTELDLQLGGWGEVAEDHLLPLAFERGWTELARLDGPALIRAFGLDGADADPYPRLLALWEELLAAFPGEVPNPLLPEGQGAVLRSLRSWSRLCRAAEIDEAFLVPLVQAI